MAIKVKQGGVYADAAGLFVKKSGVYSAATGVSVKAGGSYASVSSSTLKDYTTIRKLADANAYTFPARIRPQESARKSVTVRNLGQTNVQVAFGTLGDYGYNSPSAGQWSDGTTILVGQQAVFNGTESMFARALVSGQALRLGVLTELGVN